MRQWHWIIPEGTQVVVPGGRAGVVRTAPTDATDAYRVAFPEGVEAIHPRADLTILKQHTSELPAPPPKDELRRFVIYRCIAGSRAYGLDHAGSDTDVRGIYLPPAELHWSLSGLPEQLDFKETEECYWELEKFLVLALKANPNILECLYSPLVLDATPLAQELLAMKSIFLSRFVFQTYNGYVLSQFKKIEQDLRNQTEPKWKHVMHLIRLLLAGIAILETGEVQVGAGTHRDRLLAIRNGVEPWESINTWRLDLHREFESAHSATRLPERPDYEAANWFLLRARRQMVEREV